MRLTEYLRSDLWGGIFRTRNWPLLAFGSVAIVFGLLGFSQCTADDCRTHSFAERLFRTIDLIRMTSRFTPEKHPWLLVIAQLMMPLALVAGAVRLFIVNVRRDLKVVMVRRLRGHVIICGLGDTGTVLAQQMARSGRHVVAICLDPEESNVRACERAGVLVLRGDAMECALLEIAGVRRSGVLFVTCGSDAINIEVALRADQLVSSGARAVALQIWVELRQDWLYDLVVGHRHPMNAGGAATIRIFNLHAKAARFLLQSPAFVEAVDGECSRGDVLLIGDGPVIGEVAAQAFEGLFAVPGCERAITMLSADEHRVRAMLHERYPGLAGMSALSVERLATGHDGLPDVSGWLAAHPVCAVVLELANDTISLQVGVKVRQKLDESGHHAVPVFVRVWRQTGLGDYLSGLESAAGGGTRLAPFGDLDTLAATERLLTDANDRLAIAAHEVYCQTMPDAEATAWERLPEAIKQSNRDFADHIAAKLRAVSLSDPPTDEQIERLAQIEHFRWSRTLTLRGWRHGPRDALAKRHPLLVDWEDLDQASRQINREMVARIPRVLDQHASSR